MTSLQAKLTPRDCAFAVCIPVTQVRFRAVCRTGPVDGYARRFSCWEQYRQQVVVPFARLCRDARRLGAAIYTDIRLGGFARGGVGPRGEAFGPPLDQGDRQRLKSERTTTLRELLEDWPVVTLVAHFDKAAIEFSDGFAGLEAVEQIVPRGFSRVLDLCVCHPVGLVETLRERHPLGTFVRIDREASVYWWFAFYRAFLQVLDDRPHDYLEAIQETYRLLLKDGNRRDLT